MGQNLLIDKFYLNRIVQSADLKTGDNVVEVGAGLGMLTEALVETGAKVWALEIDSGFFRSLQDTFGASDNPILIHGDALKFDFRGLAEKIGKLYVVANLPYNVSSRLIFMFYENRDIFSGLHILLQKEVAERLIASAGTKEYGVLTVLLGVSARVDVLFHIPAKAFIPAPEVTSSLVHISFPDPPPTHVSDSGLLIRLVKASFAGRRKTLRNTLRNAPISGFNSQVLELSANQAKIDLGRRGETLSPDEFAKFADAIRSNI